MAATAHSLKKESELRFEVERGQRYTIKVGLAPTPPLPNEASPITVCLGVARRLPFRANSTSPFPSPPASPSAPGSAVPFS